MINLETILKVLPIHIKEEILKKKIESENGKVPSVLCVICGLTNAAYQRPDGVYVIPITALKP